MKIHELKTGEIRPTLTINSEDSIQLGLERMAENDVHHLVVIHNSEVKGVVDESSLLKYLLAYGPEKASCTVGEVGLDATPMADVSMEISEALNLIRQSKSGAVLINGDDASFGIITERDFLNFLCNLLSEESEIHPILKSELRLANPLVQNIMRTLSDVGI